MSDRSLSKSIAAGKDFLSKKTVKLLPLLAAFSLGLSSCKSEQNNVGVGVFIGLIALIAYISTLKPPDIHDIIPKHKKEVGGDE